MSDSLDVDLADREQLDEIDLLADLMALAAGSTDPLDARAVDRTLGLRTHGLAS
jgi:hypothetical protein